MSDIKIKDLVFNRVDGKPIRTGCGVYIFKNSERTYYIGNCVARNFIERIPAHFDIRHVGWFNSLLKAIIKNKNILIKDMISSEINYELENSAQFAFDNLNLILMNFPTYSKDQINNLEKLLAEKLIPINKRFRRLKNNTIPFTVQNSI
ncbi:hypothetical protein [Flavobacterium sp. 7A]|uniref:hypothetical protein n=1 Tax=Flavobacterium sp. 7A TaxID=2940571 RepID=UPI002227BE14|nr:hypothetical protein [Flavobacterium sp. 7A]MCW2119971.1 hypothetical protein [Flavobacterium sp. 7A]